MLSDTPFFAVFLHGAHARYLPRINDTSMTSFPKGPCSLGDSCDILQYELQNNCPGCKGLIHVICRRVLEVDEGTFLADLVICPKCDPRLQMVLLRPNPLQQQPNPNPLKPR
jgi:hypothetical protein